MLRAGPSKRQTCSHLLGTVEPLKTPSACLWLVAVPGKAAVVVSSPFQAQVPTFRASNGSAKSCELARCREARSAFGLALAAHPAGLLRHRLGGRRRTLPRARGLARHVSPCLKGPKLGSTLSKPEKKRAKVARSFGGLRLK